MHLTISSDRLFGVSGMWSATLVPRYSAKLIIPDAPVSPSSRNEKGCEWHERRALARLSSSEGNILDEQTPRYDNADWQRRTSESTALSAQADVQQSVNGPFHFLCGGG
uniref:Uncharacterized protein n=1 Tax=Arundo donax TaxID=35708 RepID=A0A0A9HI78_ARUDO